MRVLIVEDEPDMRNVVATALREQGFAVDESADGEDGLSKATAWNYDVVLLDVMLPKMDGWRVLESLRSVKSTPVLMLTARDGVSDRVRGLNGGADDYLAKPFELAELLARARALIRRSAGRPAPVIRLGDVEIDTVSRIVTKAGQATPFTAKEYSLIELLTLRRGELVTRTMIYERLFDENEDSLSNLVDVYVSNIRRKLGHDFVTTRRGQGYMIHD